VAFDKTGKKEYAIATGVIPGKIAIGKQIVAFVLMFSIFRINT
jgi:hypothetical protein